MDACRMTRRSPIDAFTVLARQLAGRTVPQVPPLPGRLHSRRDDLPGAFDLQAMTAEQVSEFCQVPLRTARQRIAAAKSSGDWSALLERTPIKRRAEQCKPETAAPCARSNETQRGAS
jgi:hypothetical protein